VKLEHAAINVPDVKAAAQWYVDNLEMRIVIAGQAAPYMTFIADKAGSMIELYTRTDIAPPDYSAINPFNLIWKPPGTRWWPRAQRSWTRSPPPLPVINSSSCATPGRCRFRSSSARSR
jgi:hypothetical protein